MKKRLIPGVILGVIMPISMISFTKAQTLGVNDLPIDQLTQVNTCANQINLYLNDDRDADGFPDK